MNVLEYAPVGWSPDKLQAFNDVVSACLGYYLYTQASGALGITGQDAKQIGTDVGNLIKNTLVPRLVATP